MNYPSFSQIREFCQLPQTFYKKPLPNFLIPFSSEDGKALFKDALVNGKMESYWTLAEQFNTQSEPACQFKLVLMKGN